MVLDVDGGANNIINDPPVVRKETSLQDEPLSRFTGNGIIIKLAIHVRSS